MGHFLDSSTISAAAFALRLPLLPLVLLNSKGEALLEVLLLLLLLGTLLPLLLPLEEEAVVIAEAAVPAEEELEAVVVVLMLLMQLSRYFRRLISASRFSISFIFCCTIR